MAFVAWAIVSFVSHLFQSKRNGTYDDLTFKHIDALRISIEQNDSVSLELMFFWMNALLTKFCPRV